MRFFNLCSSVQSVDAKSSSEQSIKGNMKKSIIQLLVYSAAILEMATWAEKDQSILTPEQVFAVEAPTCFWQKTYTDIKGKTLTEKSRKARTTLDMKAVSAMRLYAKQQELAQVGKKLWKSLPEELTGMEDRPRERFLKTHVAWRLYVQQQIQFLANTSGGGSMYSILEYDVQIKEIEWRIRLYQDLLGGKNVVKHSLYFYELTAR